MQVWLVIYLVKRTRDKDTCFWFNWSSTSFCSIIKEELEDISESVNRRRTDNTMPKRKRKEGQTTIYNTDLVFKEYCAVQVFTLPLFFDPSPSVYSATIFWSDLGLIQLRFGYLRPSKIQRIQLNQKHVSLSRVLFTKYITNQTCIILGAIMFRKLYFKRKVFAYRPLVDFRLSGLLSHKDV
jgi:hypothetical protein